MLPKFFLCFLALFLAVAAGEKRRPFSFHHGSTTVKPNGRCGDPLFLTPYIESGQLHKGRQLAKVKPLHGDIESYAGFLTVDKRYNSNMYFWFFTAAHNQSNAPIALWLQGGPGGSSVYSVFSETGPYEIKSDLSLEIRKHNWPQEINVLYIDNPVGAGFSFTDSAEGFSTNENDVAVNLYEALIQFFTLFPEFQKNRFYVTGESYAGKYIPSISYYIHEKNPTANLTINLKGMAIGDGFTDPYNMMVYSSYLYEIGFVDEAGRRELAKIENQVRAEIRKEEYVQALETWNVILSIYLTSSELGSNSVYNYVSFKDIEPTMERTEKYLAKNHVRERLHVGNLAYWLENYTVYDEFEFDMMKSVKHKLEALMDNGYRVVTYNGQLDIIVAYPLTENYVRKLNWKGKCELRKAQRTAWNVKGETAGYAKTVGNYTEILVRNAGHMVPADQPLWALDLITRVTHDIPF